MLLQHVQNLGGVAVFVAGVKGEVEHLLPFRSPVQGVVLGQVFAVRVADGRLALLLEAQPPVGDLPRSRHSAPCPGHHPRQDAKAQQGGQAHHHRLFPFDSPQQLVHGPSPFPSYLCAIFRKMTCPARPLRFRKKYCMIFVRILYPRM